MARIPTYYIVSDTTAGLVEKLKAERDEARRIARQMKAERDEALNRLDTALRSCKLQGQYIDALKGELQQPDRSQPFTTEEG